MGDLGHPADGGFHVRHLPRHPGGDLLTGLGDAFGHHAVVRAADHHRPPGNIYLRVAGQGGYVHDQLLESPQAPQRLGDAVPLVLSCGPGRLVRLPETGAPLCQQLFHGYASFHWSSMRSIQSRTSMR